ncbi:FkbM family methyltransferase [Streptomyces sp. NPDC053431]|uniref:FkbM family methyltransferase n=1 Tax=Streptomyces sp. NPDC053431 TaxID=3365703 RepID=UPI0037CE1D6D
MNAQRIAELIERYEVNFILDVGANICQYAELLRNLGYEGRIASFEPVRQFYDVLAEKAAADAKWDVYELALGSDEGTAELNVTPNTLSSIHTASEYGSERFHSLRHTVVQEVQVRRLENLLDDLMPEGLDNVRIFLKMDTQGFDLEVFSGLGRHMRSIVGIQSEMALLTIYEGMPRMPEALSAYEEAGFEVAGMAPVNQDGRTLRILEYDCLMVRSDCV